MTIKNMTKEINQSSIEKDAANDSGGVAGERKRFPARIAAGEAESEGTE